MKANPFIQNCIGFCLSIALTLAAFFLVTRPAAFGLPGANLLFGIVIGLAVIQLIVQLIFFLGLASGGRAQTVVLLITIGLILLIVTGSIWIMNHLNYNMTPQQVQQYINDQQGGF